MNRLRSLISQSPAIVIATTALALSMAGGATAATVMANRPARVVWHNLTLINHWKYGGFDSFHASYYVDANRVIHLRGSVRLGTAGKPAFQLPKGLRPSHILSIPIYTSNGPEEMNILTNGDVLPFDNTGSDAFVRDFTSFDGVSFPEG